MDVTCSVLSTIDGMSLYLFHAVLKVRKIYESERRLHAGDHTLELLAQDFEKNYHMYIYPVHWQFAQIDQHPSDRYTQHVVSHSLYYTGVGTPAGDSE